MRRLGFGGDGDVLLSVGFVGCSYGSIGWMLRNCEDFYTSSSDVVTTSSRRHVLICLPWQLRRNYWQRAAVVREDFLTQREERQRKKITRLGEATLILRSQPSMLFHVNNMVRGDSLVRFAFSQPRSANNLPLAAL